MTDDSAHPHGGAPAGPAAAAAAAAGATRAAAAAAASGAGPAPDAADAAPRGGTGRVQWALLYGNFAIGCGIMVVPGSLNDVAHSLGVGVALAGQLVAIAAAVLCFGAPLFAAVVAGWDRRRLLVLSLVLYAAGHAVSTLATSYAALVPLRVLSVLGAAVFTPQAAAAIGTMTPPHERGRAMTFVTLGWSLASVVGMPVHSYIGEAFGWRYAFGLVSLLACSAAWSVWRAMPDGVRPPAMNLAAWRDLARRPVLIAIVFVSALAASGQFTLFAYLAPYYRQALGATAGEVSFLFFWFGAFGLVGNVLLARHIDRFGPARAVTVLLLLVATTLLAWPLATGVAAMAVALVPWGLGCFSSNSAQQARLGLVAPALAPALLALNTSAIYLGQAIGAAGGGVLVAAQGYGALPWTALAWIAAALALSLWAQRRLQAQAPHG